MCRNKQSPALPVFDITRLPSTRTAALSGMRTKFEATKQSSREESPMDQKAATRIINEVASNKKQP